MYFSSIGASVTGASGNGNSHMSYMVTLGEVAQLANEGRARCPHRPARRSEKKPAGEPVTNPDAARGGHRPQRELLGPERGRHRSKHFEGEAVHGRAAGINREVKIFGDSFEGRQKGEVHPIFDVLVRAGNAQSASKGIEAPAEIRCRTGALSQGFEKDAHTLGLILVAKQTGAGAGDFLGGLNEARSFAQGFGLAFAAA